MKHENLIKVRLLDARKGDLLLHENGDRLTVTDAFRIRQIAEITAGSIRQSGACWGAAGFSLYRVAEPLPDVPGLYLNSADAHHPHGATLYIFDGKYWSWDGRGEWDEVEAADVPRDLTRIVPMPDEEGVRAAISAALPGLGDINATQAADAVMALFEQEGQP